MKQSIESKLPEVDLSEAFLTLPVFEFLEEERKHKKETILKISVDLSKIEDKSKFVFLARRLKAFLEKGSQNGQERYATVRARQEQLTWEANVFSSGVKFERVN